MIRRALTVLLWIKAAVLAFVVVCTAVLGLTWLLLAVALVFFDYGYWLLGGT